MHAIRHIIFKRGASVTHSITFNVKADISNVTFRPEDTYKNQPEKRQKIMQDAFAYAAISGLDKAGRRRGQRRPPDLKFERVTATVLDENNQRMYYYRKSDKTFWERVHIPTSASSNSGIWNIKDDYVKDYKG
ncbi:hypothetical protein C8Q76DRAFT_695408 [Earliella scabrosa]|nr:hypothetical protein C8Q76DRAFT_695408 [Earliella scabrosa]